jgi:hypothetical protein
MDEKGVEAAEQLEMAMLDKEVCLYVHITCCTFLSGPVRSLNAIRLNTELHVQSDR